MSALRRRWLAVVACAGGVAAAGGLLGLPVSGPASAVPVRADLTSRATPATTATGRVVRGVPVGAAASASGLWVADTNGGVTDEAAAGRFRDAQGRLAQTTISVVATPRRTGYWLLGAAGAVTPFGTAGRFGSAPAGLPQPVVAMASTRTGRGYWLVGRGGAVERFGDATALGSGHAASPYVGIVASPTGAGYWLYTRAGRVQSFGSARSHGSVVGADPSAPVVSMASTPSGQGYWLLARDGRVMARGAATVYGSVRGEGSPALQLVATPDGRGYWILFADGAIRSFGDAGSMAPVPSTGVALVGQVVTIDPGHDGGNASDPAYIDHLVPSGPGMVKACDTDGASTDAGYPEHAFNWDVANRLARALEAKGATVVLTRSSDTGVGPCVNQRAEIGNAARSDAAISIHADGGPASGRGFAVLEPALFPGYNDAVVPPSDRLGLIVRNSFEQLIEPSTYDGVDGLQVRNDLGGLNLSTVPKVLIECANMRNATDAALVSSPTWRQQAADRLASAFTAFLTTTGA